MARTSLLYPSPSSTIKLGGRGECVQNRENRVTSTVQKFRSEARKVEGEDSREGRGEGRMTFDERRVARIYTEG